MNDYPTYILHHPVSRVAGFPLNEYEDYQWQAYENVGSYNTVIRSRIGDWNMVMFMPSQTTPLIGVRPVAIRVQLTGEKLYDFVGDIHNGVLKKYNPDSEILTRPLWCLTKLNETVWHAQFA